MGRSRTGPRAPAHAPSAAPLPTLAAATRPRVWQGIGYRPLPDAAQARALFDYAAVPWPEAAALAFAWGAFAPSDDGERLIAAVGAERRGAAAFLYGPVVIADTEPLEAAAQLVAAALDHATAAGIETLFARPQALDRVWIRFGFIPVPESTLPVGLAGRAGAGLYAWRGGSALWSLRETVANAGA